MRTLSNAPRLESFGLALLMATAIAVPTGCSSSDGGTDAGTGDTGIHPDAANTTPDAAEDAGPRDVFVRDATTPDAAHYCTTNDEVRVGNTGVTVGASSMMSAAGAGRPDLFCANPDPGTFNDSIFVRGCINFIGGAPNMAELGTLEFAVFPVERTGGGVNDPTFDPTTGADRGEKLPLAVTFDTSVAPGTCPSQVQVDIGYDEPSATAIQSERELVIRVRTATSAAMQTFATQYFVRVVPRNDNLTSIGGGGDCNSQTCYHRLNFVVVRTSVLQTAIGAAGMPIPGSANLRDGQGAGYAAIELADCNDTLITRAVAGFEPEPLNDGYLSGAMIDLAATESTADGIYFALGFPGMAANGTAGAMVTAGVGANRDGTCTEEYAGASIAVYPDAISVIRTGRENALRAR